MPIIDKQNLIGAWAFSIGILIAIVVGISASSFLSLSFITTYSSQIYAILVLLGLIVGFFINVSRSNATLLLLSGAVLVIVSKFGMESVTGTIIGIGVGNIVSSTFSALLTLSVTATLIIAIKTLFSTARI